jgi:anti-sigma factor RsiW
MKDEKFRIFLPCSSFTLLTSSFTLKVSAMSPHPTEQTLSAYYDGELAVDVRADVARHVVDCSPCTLFLTELRNISGRIAGSSPDGLSQIAWARLHAKLDDVLERGLVRYAWEVSGVAAAILLIGSIWLTQLAEPSSATAAAVPPWIGAQASANPIVAEAPTPAAAWYLADAKSNADFGQ